MRGLIEIYTLRGDLPLDKNGTLFDAVLEYVVIYHATIPPIVNLLSMATLTLGVIIAEPRGFLNTGWNRVLGLTIPVIYFGYLQPCDVTYPPGGSTELLDLSSYVLLEPMWLLFVLQPASSFMMIRQRFCNLTYSFSDFDCATLFPVKDDVPSPLPLDVTILHGVVVIGLWVMYLNQILDDPTMGLPPGMGPPQGAMGAHADDDDVEAMDPRTSSRTEPNLS